MPLRWPYLRILLIYIIVCCLLLCILKLAIVILEWNLFAFKWLNTILSPIKNEIQVYWKIFYKNKTAWSIKPVYTDTVGFLPWKAP